MGAIIEDPLSVSEAKNSFVFQHSEIRDRQDTNPKPAELPWEIFCDRFSKPDCTRGDLNLVAYQALDSADPEQKKRRAAEKDGPAWLPVTFKPDGKRVNEDVQAITVFVGDCDDGQITVEQIQQRLRGIEHFAHTTYSHTPEKPKLRFIVPFKKPASPGQLPALFDHFNARFGGHLDPVGKKPAQLYYKPSCPFDAAGLFQCKRGNGEYFEPESLNPARPAPRRDSVSLGFTAVTRFGRSTTMPRACRDGERHTIGLSAIGRWINHGFDHDQVLALAREWNATNVDAWSEEKLVSSVAGLFRTDERNHPDRETDCPWEDIGIPPGYQLTREGVYQISETGQKPVVKLSGAVWVSAQTRDPHSSNWGRVIEWIDGEGCPHCVAFPAERFHEQGNVLAQDLARDGLMIIPGKEKQLATYLGIFVPAKRLRSVTRLGWLDDTRGGLVFMLPEKTFSKSPDETYVFQPERHSPTASTIASQGTLEQWQREVAAQIHGNSILVFSISLAFAGPLMKPLGVESGGFHFFGRSSHGKTTAAQVAASVWGCGADPAADADRAYVQRWNTTHNGLEGLACAHNDSLIVLDEIGTCNAKDFGKVIYNLAGGRGKVAMSADRNLKPTRNWRLLFLSTGEISARQKMEEEGDTPKAGQLLRLMDIPILKGVVQDPHGLEPAEYVNRLKSASSSYYGGAGPAFIEVLTQIAPDLEALKNFLTPKFERALDELAKADLEPEQRRAMRRLALVLVAGELAVDWGILPIQRAEILTSVLEIRDAWLRDLDVLPDAARGVELLRGFLLKHRIRLQDLSDQNNDSESQNGNALRLPRDLAGYIDRERHLYLLTLQGFREAVQGIDVNAVLRELAGRGLLFRNDKTRFTSKHRIPEVADRLSLYAIKFDILEAEDKE